MGSAKLIFSTRADGTVFGLGRIASTTEKLALAAV